VAVPILAEARETVREIGVFLDQRLGSA